MRKVFFYVFIVLIGLFLNNDNNLVSAQSNKEIKNVKYNEQSASQELDIYLPENKDDKKLTTVIFFHGGSYAGGDKSKGVKGNRDYFLKRGYAFVSVNYRLSGEKTYPAAVDDAKSAIRYLKENANKYNLNIDQFYLIGFSAGANLISMVASTEGIEALGNEKILYNNQDSRVAGIIAVSGFYDLNSYFYDKKITNSKVANEKILNYYNQDSYDENKPFISENNINYIKNIKKPILLIHGNNDKTVNVEQSKQYYKEFKMRSVFRDIQFYEFEGYGHEYSRILCSKKGNNIGEWIKTHENSE